MIQFDTGWGVLQREYRDKAGLTVRKLAELTGIAASNLNRYELGTAEPNLRAVKLLVAVLSIPYISVLSGVPKGIVAVSRKC